MNMKALNRLLGRATIDPSLVNAVQAGRIDDLLAEDEFSPEIRRELLQLEASTFSDFAVQAYELVRAREAAEARQRLPSPSLGLDGEVATSAQGRAA
ncbi:MAG: hypothetical protein AB1449_02500 [Chloroflexota bacterium]